MIAQTNQLQTNKQEFRWSCRKKGKNVLNFCQQLTFCLTLAGGLFMTASAVEAGPVGGNVVGGSATIAQSGANTNITQHSNRAIIEWSNFDINSGETVRFLQNSASSIALNRVINSQQATAINGNLLANGKVIVINPNGVVIGNTGNIDVGGFVASTADIGNNDFMNANGAMNFNIAGKANGLIENNGKITIQDAGLGLLVAPHVRNNGLIQGNMAKLQLGAGDTFGVDLYGDGLLHLAVAHPNTNRTLKAENTASGTIVAQAGKVVMTAAAVNNTVNSVINNSGVIEAKGLVSKGGEIILTGEGTDITVSGKIDASGKTGGGSIKIGGDKQGTGTLAKAKTVTVTADAAISANAQTSGNGGSVIVWSDDKTSTSGVFSAKGGSTSGNGGFVETSAKDVLDVAGTRVDTSAAHGTFGLWLLDPVNYTINSSNVSAINNATSDVLVQADNNISVDTNINMTNLNVSLTIDAGNSITVDNGSITLNGGNLTMKAGGVIGGNNGFLQTNGGDINLTSNGAMRIHKDMLSGGGNVTLTSGGSFEFLNRKIHTAGGDVSIASNGSLSVGNANISTAGGDVDIYAGGSATTHDTKINTTGGNTPATISISETGRTKTFTQVYTNNATLQQTGNAGNVTIRANGNAAGNQFCISAGGHTCGTVTTPVAPTPQTVVINVKANDLFITYGQPDPTFTYTYTGTLRGSDAFIGQLIRDAGLNVGTYTINQGSLNLVSANTASYVYNIVYTPGVLKINPALLTITAQDQSKTYGSTHHLGNSAVTVSGLQYGDQIATATLTSNGSAAQANVGTYDINASNAVGAGSTDLSNYSISYSHGTLTVNKANLTVTANNRTKTYGDVLALGTTGFTTSGLKAWDSVNGVALSSSGTGAGAQVGNYAINAQNATGTGLSNYTITYAAGNLTVNPALLTITTRDQYKVYGDTKNVNNALFAYSVSGLKNGDRVTGVTLSSNGSVATANVGGYDINASNITGTGLGNYTPQYNTGTLNVTPAALLITADSFSKTYGNTVNFTNSHYNVYGLKNSDSVSGVTMTSNGAAATANVGLYGIFGSNATGTGLGNYSIVYTPGLMLVNPAALTITARDQYKVYGDTKNVNNALFAYNVSGLKNSDRVTGVNLTSAGAVATANVGDYAINGSNATGVGLSNYTITYNPGTLHVNPALLLITADSFSKTYGNTVNFTNSHYNVYGLKNSDSVSGVTMTSNGASATANVGLYGIFGSNATGTGLGNYSIVYTPGLMLVNPAALTITARDQSKTYGQTHDLGNTEFDVAGLKNTDGVSTVNLSSAGAAGTANAGSYGIFANGASGNGLSNYTITYNSGTLNVDKAALTVAANNQNKTFGNNFTFNGSEFSVAGTLYNGDNVGGATFTSTGAPANAAIGLHDILIGNASGNGLSNYNITYQNGTMSVAAVNVPTNPATPTTPTPPLAALGGFDPQFSINPLNRPVVSYANKVIVRDASFEAFEMATLNTDVALRYTGATNNAAAMLNALQPAAGTQKSSPEDLANIEPAAGGAPAPSAEATSNLSDVNCANDFLDNRACQY